MKYNFKTIPRLMWQSSRAGQRSSSRAQINGSAWEEGMGTRERKESLEEGKESYPFPSYLSDRVAGSSVESQQVYSNLGTWGKW